MKKKFLRSFALFTAAITLLQSLFPFVSYALTSGPAQPELQTFQSVGTTEMVDLFTGDFSYNIPLLDVGGYPINISYRSGITMDQEASWVGLGWNINPGVINRTMRGLPDDFKGDVINKSFNIKNNLTVGINGGAVLEIVGLNNLFSGGLDIGAGFYYNTYKGLGITTGVTPSIAIGKSEGGQLTSRLGIQFDSQNGLDITPSFGYSRQVKNSQLPLSRGLNAQLSISSRAGLKDASWGFSQSYTDYHSSNGKSAEYSTQQGTSVGASISFASSTYIPSLDLPYHSNAFSLRVTGGAEITVAHPGGYLSGFFNEQHLSTNTQTAKGYGYLFSKTAENDATALMDFNREKDGPFRETAKTLPVTNFTYDLYAVSGEGVGGQFRPFRGDVGIVRDPYVKNTADGGSVGAEIGVGNLAHGGVDISYNHTSSHSGMWVGENFLPVIIPFKGNDGSTLYESFYFKNVADNGAANATFYNDFGGVRPLHSKLASFGSATYADQYFMEKTGLQNYSQRSIEASQSYKKKRERRNQVMSFLNNVEAHAYGLEDTIWSHPLNVLTYNGCNSSAEDTAILRIARPLHHMSEVTVLNPDGKRYLYGIPAYNNIQKEVSFAVSNDNGNSTSGYVEYTPGVDNSIDNNRGKDKYFNSTVLPAYAHSYLLTGVLSPDYIDMTGDGISDDDEGDAVKFNYTRALKNYSWRLPFKNNNATYVEGFMSDTTDDKGNYVYGEKEIWYSHSIESRNFIAHFILSDRNDGLGVEDENGGKDSDRKLKRLKEIKLYSKEELIKKGSAAIPIKTVHFEYSYKLCKNVENSAYTGAVSDSLGKLTLNEIWFSYGDNTKGRLNGYQFVYSGSNPSYSTWKSDRWGNFQNNNSLDLPPNKDYPYTYQDSVEAGENASAWSLTQITLPSGAKINVTYESDDYGYVQDKRAMQMYRVIGLADDAQDDTVTDELYSATTNNLWIKLDAGKNIDDAGGVADLAAGIDKIYFKFKVGMTKFAEYEYITGYAIKESIEIDNSNSNYFWLKLKQENIDQVNNPVHPVSKAAWQFLRVNLPDKTHAGSPSSSADVEEKILSMMGLIPEIEILFTGFNSHAISQGWAKEVVVSDSWVRLNNLGYKKYGGGSRVKKITMNDNWYSMTGNQIAAADYGQTYDYRMYEPGNQYLISSGVAAYEPLHGGDEIPHRSIIATYEEEARLAPDNEFYVESPLGESLYPAPTIGYRQVTITNLKRTGIARTATGKSVHQFYTSYDFPTLADHTDLNPKHYKPTPLLQIFKTTSTDYMTASQGYTVACNDMHGKPKGEFSYEESGALISSTEYKYKVEDETALHQKLVNDNIKVVDSTGAVKYVSLGRDIDIWHDMREQASETEGFTSQINLETFTLGFLPFLAAPSFYAAYSSEKVRFRSSVTTKYIFQKGILDRVIKMQNGSSITTYNEAFDEQTGEVLLTKVLNEYGNSLYTFNYPAHWMYSGMAGAHKNIGAEIKSVDVTNGVITPLPPNVFEPGDEIGVYTPGGSMVGTCHIIKPQSDLILVDQKGKPVTIVPKVNLKVIRSGHRNLQAVTVGSVTSKNDPLSGGNLAYNPTTSQIVDVSALEFKDEWQTNCKKLKLKDCIDMDGLVGTCFRSFYNALCMTDNFWVTQTSNYSVRDLFDDFSDDTLLLCQEGDTFFLNNQHPEDFQFYYTYPPTPSDYITYYEAQLGDSCKLIIQSISGNPIPIDLLEISPTNTDSTIELNDNAYAACIPLYIGASLDPVATACIKCTSCTEICTDLATNDTINPYRFGLLGNWRPWKDHVYYTDRGPFTSVGLTNIAEQGVFEFNVFWEYSSGTHKWYPNSQSPDAKWVRKNEITIYNAKGTETENRDALDRYSAALYGYIESLPTAVASNSQPRQIAFDGFEDYTFANTCSGPCYEGHWSFLESIDSPNVYITNHKSHSGRRSIIILPGQEAQVYRSLLNASTDILEYNADHIKLETGGCLYRFSPEANDSTYVLSAWVNEDDDCPVVSFTHDTIQIITDGAFQTNTFLIPKGPIIDGWQRIEGTFTVPSNSVTLIVKLISSHDNNVYFDDIRIFPYYANMKSYVYDPFNLRLMATLDENNYATFYEYNDEGSMIRLKKETERGIVTIQENVTELKKQ